MEFAPGFEAFGKALQLSQDQKFNFEVQKRSIGAIDRHSMTEKEFEDLKSVCLGLLKQNMMLQNLNSYHLTKRKQNG